MMEKNENRRQKLFVRLLALLCALMVIGGSVSLARGMGPDRGASSLIPSAMAESGEFKTLKKGSSGALVRNAQRALKELGYYSGKVDGNFSKAFEEAVIAFQKDFDLEANGALDEETYLLITDGLSDLEEAAPQKTEAPKPLGTEAPMEEAGEEEEITVEEGESYSDKEHVAAYLFAFGELPPNYITKREAQALGWDNRLGNLWQVAPGKSIGGDRFGNYEGLLPRAKGRQWYECDANYSGRKRGAERVLYSSDGLFYYTNDHYETFTEMFPEVEEE